MRISSPSFSSCSKWISLSLANAIKRAGSAEACALRSVFACTHGWKAWTGTL